MVGLLNVRQAEGEAFTYSFIHSTAAACALNKKSPITARGGAGRSRERMLSTVVPSHTFIEEAPESRSSSQPASWRYFMISSLTQLTSLESNTDKSCETPQDEQLTHMDPPRLAFQV